jgi:hypothetical protein
MRLFYTLALTAILSACTTPLVEAPADTPDTAASQAFDITEVTCWELMTLPEDDAGHAFTLFYGYAAGANGQPLQKSEIVEKVIVATIDTCAENPSTPALQVFAENWNIK